MKYGTDPLVMMVALLMKVTEIVRVYCFTHSLDILIHSPNVQSNSRELNMNKPYKLIRTILT